MRKDIKFQIFLLIFANIKAILLSNAYFTLILQPKLGYNSFLFVFPKKKLTS